MFVTRVRPAAASISAARASRMRLIVSGSQTGFVSRKLDSSKLRTASRLSADQFPRASTSRL
jgi:hypothetical protein